MTVKDLMSILEKCDPENKVFSGNTRNSEDEYDCITRVVEIWVKYADSAAADNKYKSDSGVYIGHE